MYISEFWCGFLACILGELALSIIAAILIGTNGKKVGNSDEIHKPILDDNNKD